jgi:small subunit ribosomal protein S7
MARRHGIPKRKINPDPKYKSIKLAKFMNRMMKDGKKSLSERIIYGAIDMLKVKSPGKGDLELFELAIERAMPAVEVKSRRVGGATFPVPIEVQPARAEALSMSWIIDGARGRKEKSMAERLAAEIMDAVEGRGHAMKKKDEVHRMADANKAFSHYRW